MPSKISFFCHYPHYYHGTINTQIEMDPLHVAMLLTLAQDKDDAFDLVSDYCEEIEDDADTTIYALDTLFMDTSAATIIKDLETTGTFADMWEEGSFALSMNGFGAAKDAVRAIEAQLMDLD